MIDDPPAIVIDGDTIRVGAERVRIMNIDVPETEGRARCNAVRRLASVATRTLTDIIMGERLEIETARQRPVWPHVGLYSSERR